MLHPIRLYDSMNRMAIKDLNSRSDFIRRLAYYLIGIAIGLCLLGFFEMARRAEMAERQAAEQAQSDQSQAPHQSSTQAK